MRLKMQRMWSGHIRNYWIRQGRCKRHTRNTETHRLDVSGLPRSSDYKVDLVHRNRRTDSRKSGKDLSLNEYRYQSRHFHSVFNNNIREYHAHYSLSLPMKVSEFAFRPRAHPLLASSEPQVHLECVRVHLWCAEGYVALGPGLVISHHRSSPSSLSS